MLDHLPTADLFWSQNFAAPLNVFEGWSASQLGLPASDDLLGERV